MFIFKREDVMAIRVLLADDCQPMLTAMRSLLSEDSRIDVVAEASTFAATMQAIADFKPEVLVLDLHLPESRNLESDFVKSQLVSVPQTLAVSFSNDNEAKALAESYGSAALLDKMNLYSEMVPAIIRLINERQPTEANSTRVKSTKVSRRAKA
jgi:DNA-binding NarL/FixJ family response regulator